MTQESIFAGIDVAKERLDLALKPWAQSGLWPTTRLA